MPDLPGVPRFCIECGNPLPTGAKFCPNCGTSISSPPPTGIAQIELAAPEPVPGVPAELRAKYQQAQDELRGDRREVVILFADLSGFTALSERLDPEEISHLMQGLLRELADVVYRYEGYVDKYIGDAIMALFGAPLAHEDDAERAVLAALDMLEVTARRSVDTDHRLSLRVGLNLGAVVAAHVGSEARHQYTVMGDNVNVASRLESAAAPNSVLVSKSVHERIAHRFEMQAVPPLKVKGKSELLEAYEVIRFRPSMPSQPAGATPFVGRQKELAVLESFFRRGADETAGFLVIEAEAGAGKSRLVGEALSRVRMQLEILEIEFSQIELPGRFSLSTDLFGQLAANAGTQGTDALEHVTKLVLGLLGEEGEKHRSGIEGLGRQVFSEGDLERTHDVDPGVARQNRWLALVALLKARAHSNPILILLEDVHWMKESDEEFLSFLFPLLTDCQIRVVATARPGSSLSWIPVDAERLELQNLDEEAAQSILGGIVDALRPRIRKELIRRSQGNPFYLEELAKSLQTALETTAASVPGTVQGLLQSRIDRLPAPARLALQMASVLGSAFSIELLARMYQLEQQAVKFVEVCEILAQEGFIELPAATGMGRFRHALMLEVAYGSNLVRIRKVLHESAARLGQEHYADRLDAEAPFFAHHYWEAGLHAEAGPHLWVAGRAAARDYELFTAERFLRRLAEVLDQHPTVLQDSQRADFISTFGDVLKNRGQLEEAEQWFEQLQDLGERQGDKAWVVTAMFHRGAIGLFRGQIDKAEDVFARGLAQAPIDDQRIIANFHSGLGLVHYSRRDFTHALKELGEALRLRRGIDDKFGLVKSLLNIGTVLSEQDNYAGAQSHYERALDLAREIGDREHQCILLLNLGSNELDLGEYQKGLNRFNELQEMVDEIGTTRLRWMILINQAHCCLRLGRIDDALQLLRTCLEDQEGLPASGRIALRIQLFETHLCAMDDAGAMEWLRQAQDLARRLAVTEREDELTLCEGRLAAAQGAWQEAVNAFSKSVDAAVKQERHSLAKIARAHQWRAMARADPAATDLSSIETDDRKSMSALLQYLWADGAASRGSLEQAVSTLAEAGELAAQVGDLSLERAAFQRQAQVLHQLGRDADERKASARAARAMLALRRGLPEELSSVFDEHPKTPISGVATGAESR